MIKFEITIDESNWESIRNLMREKKSFDLVINGENYEIRYDKATESYYAWVSMTNFHELDAVLPKRILMGVA
mgnify:FL=1